LTFQLGLEGSQTSVSHQFPLSTETILPLSECPSSHLFLSWFLDVFLTSYLRSKSRKMINKTQWNWRNKMEREERKGGRKRKKMVWSLVDQKRTASFSLSREQKDRGASKEQKIYSLTPPTAAVHSAHNSKKHDLWNIVFQSLPFFFLFLFSWPFLACFSLNSATNPSFLPVLCYFFNKST